MLVESTATSTAPPSTGTQEPFDHDAMVYPPAMDVFVRSQGTLSLSCPRESAVPLPGSTVHVLASAFIEKIAPEELTTHGRPSPPTAMRTAAPGVCSQEEPFHRKTP